MKIFIRSCINTLLCMITAGAFAATAIRFGPETSVSQAPAPADKAKVVSLAYLSEGMFKKALLFTYGSGPVGQQNIFAKYSFNDGATWSAPLLLSRDAANAPTGGQAVFTKNSWNFVVDNGKPNIFAPPLTSGPKVVVTWNSAYCPQDPAAVHNVGSYSSAVQGAVDLNEDGSPDQPFHCVWAATTADPKLEVWDVQQLTNGERDAIGEVISGNSTGTAFALAWQEDPAGLQPGEGEGRGDGGMGAHVTGGTNIWYSHAPTLNGSTLRANIAQVSDNNTTGTGQPGASRPNLQLSGSTAVLAYEETACAGGSGGKCIVYHSFPYASHDTNSGGTIISDVTKNSRRVRFILQGASAAGISPLRTVVLWRESSVLTPAAPADIVIRRGLVDVAARAASNGFLANDILADAPQNMTNVAKFGGDANAHRAIVRGSFIGLAYDQTPNMDAANPEKTPIPTANYNLFFRRSVDAGDPGSWSSAANLSQIDSRELTVVEPRVVPTPGTIVNPLTGTSDLGDVQDTSVFYVAFATERNAVIGASGRVYVSRTTDQGVTFEPFVPVSATTGGQSEAQLRPAPDGSVTAVLWMGQRTIGDSTTTQAMFASGAAVQIPELSLSMAGGSLEVGGHRTVTLNLSNRGTGDARNVTLTGSLPDGLIATGISDPSVCTLSGSVFRCAITEVLSDQSRKVSISVTSATEGDYVMTAKVSGDDVLAETVDSEAVVKVAAAVLVPDPVPDLSPSPSPEVVLPLDSGGGCTVARIDAPFDPTLLVLVALGAIGLRARKFVAIKSQREP